MTSQPAKVVEVFISYAQEDERLMRKLEKHLTTLKHQGYITFWNNLRITAGKEWNNEINRHLSTAHVILLLISSDFMASDYCTSVEVKKALLRHDAGECRVIPIILRPVYWRIAPVSKLQSLPTDGKPITEWHNKDKAFANIAEEIQKVIKEFSTDPLIESTEASSAAKQPHSPIHPMILSPTEPESKELSLKLRERQPAFNSLPDRDDLPTLHGQVPASLPDWDDLPPFEEEEYVSEPLPASSKVAPSDTRMPSLTVQQVKDAWDKVIKRVRQKSPPTATMLKYFEVVGVEDRDDQTVIAIQAQKQGHFNYVCENDRSKDVEWALTIEFGQFGRPCEIRLLPPGNP